MRPCKSSETKVNSNKLIKTDVRIGRPESFRFSSGINSTVELMDEEENKREKY